jgi:hypothetical protein
VRVFIDDKPLPVIARKLPTTLKLDTRKTFGAVPAASAPSAPVAPNP